MAYGVGANDVANAMGTSVGARAITIKQAIIIAMIFEFAGAYLAGGEVTSTIRSGIIDVETAGFDVNPELLVYGMLCHPSFSLAQTSGAPAAAPPSRWKPG